MNDASSTVSDPARPPTLRDDAISVEDSKQIKHARRQATVKFLDQLIRDVDLMFYCELSVLYYMDCSLLKFLLRALPHWFNFTPKPDIIPPIPPGQRQYIGFIFGGNLICILLHLAFRPPAAAEATRGYLHGGWFIDFIGQHSPVSRIRLLSLDILCLAIQLVMLSITLAKHEATESVSSSHAINEFTQDHDAEEAGIMRSVGMSPDDIELQLSRPTRHTHANALDETPEDSGATAQGSSHPLDTFYTGGHMLANLDIVGTVRSQWKMRRSTAVSPTSSGFETAASLAGRRFTVAFGRGQTLG